MTRLSFCSPSHPHPYIHVVQVRSQALSKLQEVSQDATSSQCVAKRYPLQCFWSLRCRQPHPDPRKYNPSTETHGDRRVEISEFPSSGMWYNVLTVCGCHDGSVSWSPVMYPERSCVLIYFAMVWRDG